MKRLLLPLLAALALPITVKAEIDKETAEFCLKATDFAGCVETIQRGLDKKRLKDVDDGLRTWTRDTGEIIRLRETAIKAKMVDGSYGDFLTWVFSLERKSKKGKTIKVLASCSEYSSDWSGDGEGWFQVKNPEEYLGKRYSNFFGGRFGESMNQLVEPAKEVKLILDEFCPQMNRLVLEAKESDRLNGIEESKKRSSSSGIKVNCDSPVWRDRPQCN